MDKLETFRPLIKSSSECNKMAAVSRCCWWDKRPNAGKRMKMNDAIDVHLDSFVLLGLFSLVPLFDFLCVEPFWAFNLFVQMAPVGGRVKGGSMFHHRFLLLLAFVTE